MYQETDPANVLRLPENAFAKGYVQAAAKTLNAATCWAIHGLMPCVNLAARALSCAQAHLYAEAWASCGVASIPVRSAKRPAHQQEGEN